MVRKEHISRRRVIKSIGSGLLGTGVSGVTGAADRIDQRARSRAAKLRKIGRRILKHEGVEQYKRFLDNHSVPNDHSEITAITEANSSSGLSTQSITCVEPDDDCYLEMKCSLSYANFITGPVVHGSVRYYVFYYQSSPPPKGSDTCVCWPSPAPDPVLDAIGFAWTDGWDISTPDRPADSMYAPEYGDWDGGSYQRTGGGGTLFEVNPKAAAMNYTPEMGGKKWVSQIAEVEVNKQPGHSSDDEIRALVNHTWNETDLDLSFSISVTYGAPSVGLSVTPKTTVQNEDIGSDANGNRLVVNGN